MKIGTLDRDMAGRIDLMAPRISANIRFERIDYANEPGENDPSHRIVTSANGNSVEIGVAWRKQKSGRTYWSCNIDQPGYPAPVSFAVFPNDSDGYDVTWSRKKSA